MVLGRIYKTYEIWNLIGETDSNNGYNSNHYIIILSIVEQ